MKDQCIIVTWLAPDQPGFLDFAYRVQSLANVYRTTLVSPYPLNQPEFAIAGIERCVLPHGQDRLSWIGLHAGLRPPDPCAQTCLRRVIAFAPDTHDAAGPAIRPSPCTGTNTRAASLLRRRGIHG